MGAASLWGLARSSTVSRQSDWHLLCPHERQHDYAGLLGELVMLKRSLHRVNGSKQAQRLAEMGRRKLRLNRLAKNEPIIPASVIKKLASLRLPNDKWVYSVCLEALLRNSSSSLGADSVAPAMTSAASATARRPESQRRYETLGRRVLFSASGE
jgi:hypothetical protein